MKLTGIRLPLVFVTFSVAGVLAIAACVSDEELPANTTPDGGNADGAASVDASSTEDASPTPVPDGGEEIADGGGLPPDEEDGGVTDLDGGFDAGPACDPLTAGAFVTTKCATLSPAHAGGDLVSGSYILVGVTSLGDATYCSKGGAYVAYDHRGALEITATSPSAATFEFLDQYRKTGGTITRPATIRYDVAVARGKAASLTFTAQDCALKGAPTSALYSTGNVNGKSTIVLRLPYGTGSANFYFVQQ